jgi:hypothetical protein
MAKDAPIPKNTPPSIPIGEMSNFLSIYRPKKTNKNKEITISLPNIIALAISLFLSLSILPLPPVNKLYNKKSFLSSNIYKIKLVKKL